MGGKDSEWGTGKGGALWKIVQVFVFRRDDHAFEVLGVPCGLKVAADKQEVYFVLALALHAGDLFVDIVELAMAASFNGHLGLHTE